jgi:UDP-N-acetylglucosamine acyltransferase
MVSSVAKSASVDSGARLAPDVVVGPECVIGPEVEIGRGTRLFGHVCLMGAVRLGEYNTVGPFVAIGGAPQDLSYWGKMTRVQIGNHNVIGERVTIHRASEKEDGVTSIGSENQFLIGAHVAHDCKLGDRITMGMGSLLGGHVRVESDVTISDGVAVHQFVSVGNDSFIGAHSKITTDVPRYMRVEGNPSVVRGINGQRMKERGLCGESLEALREAHRLIYVMKMPLEQAATQLDENGQLVPEVLLLLKFLESQHAGRVGRARERRR